MENRREWPECGVEAAIDHEEIIRRVWVVQRRSPFGQVLSLRALQDRASERQVQTP